MLEREDSIFRLTKEANELAQFTIQEGMRTGFSVDRENRVLRNVCLLGPKSENGYEYTPKAIQEAAPRYAGRVINIDHSATPSKRSLRDKAGRIMASPRYESGRLFGDIKASKGASGDLLLDEAQEQLDNPDACDVGMSHVVEGRMSKNGKLVESIGKIISVDLVFKPATMRRGLAESENETLELQEQLKSVLSGKKNALKRLEAIYEACGEDYKLEEQELPEAPVLTLETVADLREIAKDKPAIKTLLEQHDKLQKDRWVAETIIEAKLPNTEATVSALSKLDSKELMLASGKVIREAIDASKPEPKQKGRDLPTGTSLTVDKLVASVRG